ncbi:MAG: TIGR00730 family Rossman fold protein [Deltaproteobacteria bacterium]|nr:TIGR00730 family Rossman fold protein [Deltaproteobacteria bacterium]
MKRICVFCGSNTGSRPAYRQAALQLGALLAKQGLGLVYGGGNVGLMGVLANAVLEAGGEVIGVIPQSLVDKELAHHGVTQLRVTESMHERKQTMFDLSDGVMALPGGFGTLDEFFEIVTWLQLGYHAKPVGMLNVEGFWDPMLVTFAHAVGEGFLRKEHSQMVMVEAAPEKLLERFMEYSQPQPGKKWINHR